MKIAVDFDGTIVEHRYPEIGREIPFATQTLRQLIKDCQIVLLFNKMIDPCCSYCATGSKINEREVACLRKGIVSAGGRCPAFVYDPLRRDPPHPAELKTEGYSEEDFAL